MYGFFDISRTATGLSRSAYARQKYFALLGDSRNSFRNVGFLNTFAQDMID